jgi:hypothetical protein
LHELANPNSFIRWALFRRGFNGFDLRGLDLSSLLFDVTVPQQKGTYFS